MANLNIIQEIHILAPLNAKETTASTSTTSSPSPSQSTSTTPSFNKLPDFYSTKLNLLILGYIRPELDYISLEALIEDISFDCQVARNSLLRSAYSCYLFPPTDGGSDTAKGYREWLLAF